MNNAVYVGHNRSDLCFGQTGIFTQSAVAGHLDFEPHGTFEVWPIPWTQLRLSDPEDNCVRLNPRFKGRSPKHMEVRAVLRRSPVKGRSRKRLAIYSDKALVPRLPSLDQVYAPRYVHRHGLGDEDVIP